MDCRKSFYNCPKHPGHPEFIPVDKLHKELLPSNLQTKEYLESVRQIVDRTVRVNTTYVSIHRPNTYLDNASPYPYHELRGNSKAVRYGTGFLGRYSATRKGQQCQCGECRSNNNPATQFWEFVVSTALHLVYDDKEAEKTVFELFYDSENSSEVKRLYGVRLYDGWTEYERIFTDYSRVVCVSHDQELCGKLRQMIDKPIDLPTVSTGFLVSHPHGCAKRITFGNIVDLRFKRQHKKQQEQDEAISSHNQQEEIFFETCSHTKVVTSDTEHVPASEELEFSADPLYGSISYDIPTCRGSTGARVIYKGMHFTHVGSSDKGLNYSGFRKVMHQSFPGQFDDDVVSLGGSSSTGDEGFVEDIPGSEVAFESGKSEREMLLNMLNENVVDFLQDMEASYPEIAGHVDLIHHVQRYTEDESVMFPDEYRFRSSPELEHVLKKLVFKEEFAADATNSIPEEILLSQEASYWADRYLEDSQPTDQDGPYLFNPACRDTWFDQEIDLPSRCRNGAGGENGDQKKVIKIYNVQHSNTDGAEIETEPGFSYHYHGTNFRNAISILRLGIALNKGNARRDYSDGHGFYISRDYFQASNWAHRGRGFPVVIVFKTRKDFFSDSTKHIHLRATDLITLAVLKHFRSGCMEEIETVEKMINPTVDDCESISGPILLDLEGFRNEESLVLKSHQTCIRKQHCANLFYCCIDRIIFNPIRENRR